MVLSAAMPPKILAAIAVFGEISRVAAALWQAAAIDPATIPVGPNPNAPSVGIISCGAAMMLPATTAHLRAGFVARNFRPALFKNPGTT